MSNDAVRIERADGPPIVIDMGLPVGPVGRTWDDRANAWTPRILLVFEREDDDEDPAGGYLTADEARTVAVALSLAADKADPEGAAA